MMDSVARDLIEALDHVESFLGRKCPMVCSFGVKSCRTTRAQLIDWQVKMSVMFDQFM